MKVFAKEVAVEICMLMLAACAYWLMRWLQVEEPVAVIVCVLSYAPLMPRKSR